MVRRGEEGKPQNEPSSALAGVHMCPPATVLSALAFPGSMCVQAPQYVPALYLKSLNLQLNLNFYLTFLQLNPESLSKGDFSE